MIFKNLFRRKGRTVLTLLGISIGVAAIVALGAVAQGMRAGFTAMAGGSQADLVLTQADTYSVLISSVDQAVADQLRAWPEVDEVDGVLFSNVQAEESRYFFIFGYEPEGFSIAHFRIVEGEGLAEARGVRGKPLILGRQAAENMGKEIGETLSVTGAVFRIVGIYETGDGFEDGGAVIPLEEAQTLMLQPRRASMFYIKLRDPDDAVRLQARVERQFSGLTLSTTANFANQEQSLEILEAMAMMVAGLAMVIGGVVMTNTLWMSVFERTQEIGLLRAVGWRRQQVLGLILGESLTLSLLGGLVGTGLGVAAVLALSASTSWLSALGGQFTLQILAQATVTVVGLGLVGGAYPAWRASRLLPLEALCYEGGGEGHISRFLPGGMTVRNLWRRRTRTALTLLGIGISIAAIVALGALAEGGMQLFTQIWRSSQTDLVAIEANVSDAGLSAIDEQVGTRIAARPDIEAVSGIIITVASTEKNPMLLVFGYHPREFAIRHFRIIEGESLTARRQVIVGRQAAETLGLEPGDRLRLLDSNFRVAGIYETGLAYEDTGVVIGLREAQALTGKHNQVMWYGIKLRDPEQVGTVRHELETTFPDISFSLSSEVTESLSDFQLLEEMVGQISFLAVFIGGVGMLNAMLMSVLERTREIGVLRALGWRRGRVLGMILQESLALGAVGGVCGILLGLGLTWALEQIPGTMGAIDPVYTPQLFVQAVVVALVAGVVGGLYPAWRATRMRPVEALRYE
ncbi:MAG: FtsX-like permease family protein [Chloroflexota bacterium]|nr:FtsX-like permease family protein [Chloroflexota bacterium]